MVRRLLVVLVVLLVLLVVADRVGAWAAQRTVEDKVEAELASSEVESAPPEVTINRVPFLTQVLAGRYESVTLRLRNVGRGELQLPLVELTATNVTASTSTLLSGDGEIVAERVDGTATIGYESVVDLTGQPELSLTPTRDGALDVRLPAEVGGEPLLLVGTAQVEMVDGVVHLQVTDLTVEDPPVPAAAEPTVANLTAELSVEIPLPPLPYGLNIESVRAESAGLVVTVSADDVPLAR